VKDFTVSTTGLPACNFALTFFTLIGNCSKDKRSADLQKRFALVPSCSTSITKLNLTQWGGGGGLPPTRSSHAGGCSAV
jgi:hypothetical protein